VTPEPTLAVGAIVVHDGRLLLIRRARPPQAGKWSVPGGRVERGETLAEAVVREVREETGISVVAGQLLGWADRSDPAWHYVILNFGADPVEPLTAPAAGDDAAEATWCPLDDVAALPLVDGLRSWLGSHGVLPIGSGD
jgi:8-oxo-dGTP diphosphatase